MWLLVSPMLFYYAEFLNEIVTMVNLFLELLILALCKVLVAFDKYQSILGWMVPKPN